MWKYGIWIVVGVASSVVYDFYVKPLIAQRIAQATAANQANTSGIPAALHDNGGTT
ncbi:MAG: hypothetical protein PF501_14720 [Salinisphaera sp.]|jgi:hypothetical protein|nr:hypothetical protein [Salinisphaera sp.]